MINDSALQEIAKLEEIYKARWQTVVDISLLPPGITQERYCLILRRIIDTGESCLVGYNKIKDAALNYYDCIDWTIQYKTGDMLDKKCPFCGKDVNFPEPALCWIR